MSSMSLMSWTPKQGARLKPFDDAGKFKIASSTGLAGATSHQVKGLK
jgi:hypothetical protein